MKTLLEIFVPCIGFLLGLLCLRAAQTRHMHAQSTTYDLKFPADLAREDVERFLASLTGLLPPWWKRIVAQPVVSFELVAEAGSISHRVSVPVAVRGYLESSFQAHLPGLRYKPVEADDAWRPQKTAEYRTNTDARPLRVDAEGIASGILAAVQPLGRDEHLIVQWMLTAGWPVRPPRASKPSENRLVTDVELMNSNEQVAARRNKLRAPLLLAVGRIGVQAGNPHRQVQLLRRAEGPLHATRAPGAHLRRRLLPSGIVARRITGRTVPLTRFPALLNTEEAAGLLGWPIKKRAVPGLSLGNCRLLPVAGKVPHSGTILGNATFPGQDGRPVALDLSARFRHLAVTGPTGVGKTTLLTRIALQDLDAGYGLVVLDPKGDLIDNILELAPEDRVAEMIVLDASRGGPAVGYNPLKATPDSRELVVEQVLGLMRTIWRANWGPRTDALLRACLFTLTAVGGMTICEIGYLLTDDAFRHRLVSGISDPFGVQAAWAQYESWSEGEQVAASSPLLNKVQAFSTRPSLRAILGQVDGAVDFPRLIQERGVLLVNLAKGTLGPEAAYLLGALLFGGLWSAVGARGHMPERHRAPVMCMVDEFQNIVKLPTPAETILTEARSYRLSLTLAHQHLGQLDADLSHAVLANARSKVVFQTSHSDAGIFARELGAGLTPEDLMGIPAYEAIAQVFAAGAVQPPATIATADLSQKLREADEVRRVSQAHFGVSRADVDAAMVERLHGHREASRQVGRTKRRQP
jgi:hypothetical protein